MDSQNVRALLKETGEDTKHQPAEQEATNLKYVALPLALKIALAKPQRSRC